MKVWQRAGLVVFLIGLSLAIMIQTEIMVKSATTGNIWIAIIFVILGALLFIVGD